MLVVVSTAYASYDEQRRAPLLASWSGVGSGRTETVNVPEGEWAYCPEILGATWDYEHVPSGQSPSGTAYLRVSLYDTSGHWLSSVSGEGAAGPLTCGVIEGPGEFELNIAESPTWVVRWALEIAEGPVRQTPTGLAEGLGEGPWLPAIQSYIDHEAPTHAEGNILRFEGDGSLFTAKFRPVAEAWSICWEIEAQPSADLGPFYMWVTLHVTGESGVLEEWRDDTPGSYGTCVNPETFQPIAENFLLIRENGRERTWDLTINGVELVD